LNSLYLLTCLITPLTQFMPLPHIHTTIINPAVFPPLDTSTPLHEHPPRRRKKKKKCSTSSTTLPPPS
jgi:hypothetical protein